ncbi:MAG TPA: MFS transporter [Candidatus Saccharimonadia bacterium]|nr:MFS transporter [Candidatus Saccharimonadia bacterium]
MPPVRRRELAAWASYDFANSGYTTVVITAVFNAYFVGVVANGRDWATLAWTIALSVSYLLVIVSAPLLGAYVDLTARRKLALAASTALCVVSTAALAACGRDDVALAVTLLIVSNFAFSTGENLIASFLPELAHDEALGRLSGYGWALGYIGGLLTLALALALIQGGGDAPAEQTVPPVLIATALVFALAALPSLLLLRERGRAQPLPVARREAFSLARARITDALTSGRDFVDLRRLLWCIVAYQAGVGTVITLAAVYTQQALGFSMSDSIRLILVVNVTAAVGAFGFGFVQDRLGHRATLAVTLVGWLAAILLLWWSSERAMVWIAANLAGLCLGASQAAGRAFVAYLCPDDREGEIFGLWGLAVKLAMIVGTLTYGLVSWGTGGDHRTAILVNALYFVAGLVLLARIDPVRGRAAAVRTAHPA